MDVGQTQVLRDRGTMCNWGRGKGRDAGLHSVLMGYPATYLFVGSWKIGDIHVISL